MKLLHMLGDVDDAWVKLVKEAKDGMVKVVKLKKHVRHELRMQTVTSKSSLGWKLVHR